MGKKPSIIIVIEITLQLLISPLFPIVSSGCEWRTRHGDSSLGTTKASRRVDIHRSGDLIDAIADVFFASSAADREPPEATADRFDKIPWIEGV